MDTIRKFHEKPFTVSYAPSLDGPTYVSVGDGRVRVDGRVRTCKGIFLEDTITFDIYLIVEDGTNPYISTYPVNKGSIKICRKILSVVNGVEVLRDDTGLCVGVPEHYTATSSYNAENALSVSSPKKTKRVSAPVRARGGQGSNPNCPNPKCPCRDKDLNALADALRVQLASLISDITALANDMGAEEEILAEINKLSALMGALLG